MTLPYPGLALTGIVLLGFARPRWLRALGIALTAATAAGMTALAVTLFRLGSDRGWTGDGPGMLVIGFLFVASIPIALGLWAAFAAQLRAWRRGRPDRGASPALALGLVVVGVAGTASERRDAEREGRPTHDAEIAALALSPDGERLVSLDAGGTLKRWRVGERRLEAARQDPGLAGATALLLDEAGAAALVLVPGGAIRVPADGTAAPETLPGVNAAASLPGEEVALAEGASVRIVAWGEHAATRRRHALPAPVTGLASDAQGWLVAALADGSLVALEGGDREPRTLALLPAAAVRLAFSPGGRWLAAADADGRGHVVDPRRGGMRPLPAWMRLGRFAFVSDERLLFAAGPPWTEGFALDPAELRSEPWLNHGSAIVGIAAAPGARETAVAIDRYVFVARSPASGHAYTSDATRLLDPRD